VLIIDPKNTASHTFSPRAGSNVIVAGTAIFGAADPPAVIQQLKDTVNAAQSKF